MRDGFNSGLWERPISLNPLIRGHDLRNNCLGFGRVRFGLHIARKPQKPDEWDPPIEPYDPYGPGASVSDYVGDEVIDD
jgi:hypothetical protein